MSFKVGIWVTQKEHIIHVNIQYKNKIQIFKVTKMWHLNFSVPVNVFKITLFYILYIRNFLIFNKKNMIEHFYDDIVKSNCIKLKFYEMEWCIMFKMSFHQIIMIFIQ